MNTIEIIMYVAVFLATTAGWSYMDGRAKRRFAKRELDYHPPYKLGVVTAALWPLQLLGVLYYFTVLAPSRAGEKRAILRDEEMTYLRKQNKELAETSARMYREIASGKDPSNPDNLLELSQQTISDTAKHAGGIKLPDFGKKNSLVLDDEDEDSGDRTVEILDRYNKRVEGL